MTAAKGSRRTIVELVVPPAVIRAIWSGREIFHGAMIAELGRELRGLLPVHTNEQPGSGPAGIDAGWQRSFGGQRCTANDGN